MWGGRAVALHQRDHKSLRLTRARIVVAILIVGVVVVIAFLLNQFVLTSSAVTYPEAPPAIAAIEKQWGYIILLPTFKPDCLTYDPTSVATKYDSASSTGQSLQMSLTATDNATCAPANGSSVFIVEAPALSSLAGNVSTVSQGRMQFAETTTNAGGGGTEIVLQWHCSEMMCRMSGTLNESITETVLKKMADSFQVARLSN